MQDSFYTSPSAPYSQEAEEATIGAILVQPAAYYGLASFLKPDDFFILRNRLIWESLVRLTDRKEPIDLLTVTQELRDMGKLMDIGGPAYLTQLVNNTPTSVHAEIYGRLVERAALRRRLMQASDEIRGLALNEELNVEEVIAQAEGKLFDVTERQLTKELIPMREAVSAYYQRMEDLVEHRISAMGVPSGFKDLDKMLGGLQKSDLLLFAGRPGMGKTSFMLSAALNMARLNARVAIFSMEMGIDQIVQRLVSMESGINSQNLRLGQLTDKEWTKFVQVTGNMSNFNIFIDDTPALNPLQLRTKCIRMQREHGVDLVVVDYVQLMNSGGAYENNRVQEISYISRQLKELARELNVPLLSAAQLSRAVEQRQDKRPQLSDLRESGCLAGDTRIYLPDEGRYVSIRELAGRMGFRVSSLNHETWKLEASEVTHAFCTGTKSVYRLTTQLGRTIRATANHRFLTITGWKRLDELKADDYIALPNAELVVERTTQFVGAELVPPVIEGAASLRPYIESGYGFALSSHPYNVGDVYWDAIAQIVPDGESDVYDLTVPAWSNFVADQIIVHNSLEQDADVVMFLYRDEVYNEATEFPNQADIIIAKHRNGPTGTISLFFEKTLTKFLNANERNIDFATRG